MASPDSSTLDAIVKIVGIILGPAVIAAAGTFVLTVFSARRQRERRERQIVRALFAEIARLVEDLTHTRYSEDSRKAVKSVVEGDKSRKVLISYGRKDDFLYRELKTEITVLPSPALTPVVAFYGQLAYVYSIVDDMQSETFGQISLPGRGSVIDELYDSAVKLRQSGLFALRGLVRTLPHRSPRFHALRLWAYLQPSPSMRFRALRRLVRTLPYNAEKRRLRARIRVLEENILALNAPDYDGGSGD